jgi:hypothetical protein
MKAIYRTINATLGAGVFIAGLASSAWAGCGDLSNLQGPLEFASPILTTPKAAPRTEAARALAEGYTHPSIVGLWNIQLLSKGNTGHNPPIPDGAVIDFGFNEWHGDGTELLNSGGHAPATENFCMGVWGQTGFLAFELNHFALSYDSTTGALTNVVNIREQTTLSPSGDSYTGTFTLDVYDTKGNHLDHLGGTVAATRVTVDTTVTAVP